MIKIDFNPTASQLRQFGWIALVGFPLIGLLIIPKFFGGPETLHWTIAALGGLSVLLALINPALIKPIYVAMMLIAIPIGFVLSFVLMGLIYYGLFTPVGLAFKLFGRDKLDRKLQPEAASYWHDRPAARPAKSYYRLY